VVALMDDDGNDCQRRMALALGAKPGGRE
jgi:hypothetical protein